MSKPRRPRRPVDGLLILDKPAGVTSNQILQWVKHRYQADKAGHTGSLDPLATGVLPICLGEATKFSHFLLEADKVYHTRLRLGQKTTTADAEGEVIEERPVPALAAVDLERVLDGFRGDILQVPSMFSALKQDGKPLVDPVAFADLFEGSSVNPAYGLTWWLPRPSLSNDPVTRATDITEHSTELPADMVVAAGAGDQRLYVIPSRRLTIVRQAKLDIMALAAGKKSGWSDTRFLELLLAD